MRAMKELKRVGVIGAGTMGSGIAQACASAGLEVVLVDVSDSALQRGRLAVLDGLERLRRKNQISEDERDGAIRRVRISSSLDDLSQSDLIIEAATEDVGLKLRIIRDAEKILASRAVLASNTSSISISQLAAVLARPGQFIGIHFFNPVPVMGLVEIVRGLQTTDETHSLAIGFAQRLGKTPITVRNNPGFVVNRILCPMLNEAIFALQEGLASAAEIDSGMRLGCNHPIGPLALADLIGLDTLLAIMQVLHDGLGESKYRPAPLLREMVDARRLGRKSGHGFFIYAEKSSK